MFFPVLPEFSLISSQLKSCCLAQALKGNYYEYTKDCYVDQDTLATLVTFGVRLKANSCLLKQATQLICQDTWICTTGLTLANIR